MGEEDVPASGFRVTDRRRFDDEGNVRPSEESVAARSEATRPAQPPPPVDDPGAAGEPVTPADAPAGSVGFTELVLSIATNAVAFLGQDGDPADGRVAAPKANLKLASQNIDILAMLKEKTAGNLNPQEEELLDSVLYDLRTLFVQVSQSQGSAG